MSLEINIAIDGYSSCGKSTIAKSIAKRYGMRYIDTGAMYRAITLYCLRKQIIKDERVNLNELIKHLDEIAITFNFNNRNNKSETFVNGENVESSIRSFQVSEHVSAISQIKLVRQKLVVIQQEIGKKKNVVMDGRDIGTKVFPDAALKFFIIADVYTRAKRRFAERLDKTITFDQILENLKKRDQDDRNRDINPLRKATDAILIDNTSITTDQQDYLIFDIIDRKLIKQ